MDGDIKETAEAFRGVPTGFNTKLPESREWRRSQGQSRNRNGRSRVQNTEEPGGHRLLPLGAGVGSVIVLREHLTSSLQSVASIRRLKTCRGPNTERRVAAAPPVAAQP